MNREIKFRAWDKKKLRWHFFDVYDGIHKKYTDDNCELMQFTGLLDKNGKEIYEDDIILVPAGKGTIKYNGGAYWIYWNDVDKTTLWDCRMKVVEVIGNIYENKDLIK